MGSFSLRRWVVALLALSAVVLLSVGGVVLLRRFESMESQMAVLGERATRSAEEAAAASRRASEASEAAAQASAQANVSEAARQTAIGDKDKAEQERLQAEASAVEAARKAEAAEADIERMRQAREAELNRMQEMLDRLVQTRRTSSGLVMNLDEKALHFEFNSAALSPESRELLSRIAGILLASGSFGLAVHGHTDDVGTSSYNQTLSESRAESVKQYFVKAGLDAGIITAKGFGKSNPIARAQDDASRARNRRVEIVLTDTKIKYLGVAGN